jgi:hypothetical protein
MPTPLPHPPLSAQHVLGLAQIVLAARKGQRVARLDEDSNVRVGTARSLGDERGNYMGREDDIRDVYLRVTLLSGFDAYWPVLELLAEIGSEFVTDYDG